MEREKPKMDFQIVDGSEGIATFLGTLDKKTARNCQKASGFVMDAPVPLEAGITTAAPGGSEC
jgi:hypothetical protein